VLLMLLAVVPLSVASCCPSQDNSDEWKSFSNEQSGRQSQIGMNEQQEQQMAYAQQQMGYGNQPPPNNDLANLNIPGSIDWMASQGPPSHDPYISGPPGWTPGAFPPQQGGPQVSGVQIDVQVGYPGGPSSQQGGYQGRQTGYGNQGGGGGGAGDFGIGGASSQGGRGGWFGGGQQQPQYGNQGGDGGMFGGGGLSALLGGGGSGGGGLFGGGGGWFGRGGNQSQPSRANTTNPNDYVPEKADMYVVQKVGDSHGIAYKDGSSDGTELPAWGVCQLPNSAHVRAIGY